MATKNQVIQWLKWAAWIAIVAVIVYFLSKNEDSQGQDIPATEQSQTLASTDQATNQSATSQDNKNKETNLESIVMPRGLSNTVVKYKGYTAHFNKNLHIPNCVVYEITASEAKGRRDREGDFVRDNKVAGCPNWWDYRDSGYDRGHMAPAGDMKWDEQAMNETFYLTNICPQDNALNAGMWNDIEVKVREWARRDKALIVITGPIVDKNPRSIGQDMDIAVPDAFFKVLLATKTNPMRAIAFICPNRACGGPLKSYAVSVDEVEERTGMNFFNALPDDMEDKLESTCNPNQWMNR
ncbi:MAG: DNA/RNA non-specific endonuclease [Muribaculaceae bacterium]|nr:DNA/RNA non-specific endonuclease [Muribaculaceae bacterium]